MLPTDKTELKLCSVEVKSRLRFSGDTAEKSEASVKHLNLVTLAINVLL